MNKSISEKILCMFLVFLTLFTCAVYAEEAFDMQFLMKNVLKIHRRRTNFKGTQAEREEIEKICKQEIAAMMTKIAETSDVAVLKPLLEDAWVFYHCIPDIVAEQEKLPPELNHKIMDFIIRNGTEAVKDGWETAAVHYARVLLDR